MEVKIKELARTKIDLDRAEERFRELQAATQRELNLAQDRVKALQTALDLQTQDILKAMEFSVYTFEGLVIHVSPGKINFVRPVQL